MSIFNEAMNGQLAGLDFVQGRIDLGDQQRKEKGLAALMGDYAAGGAPDYRGIAANGGNPLAVRQDSEQRKAMRLKELSQFAGYLAQLPPEARPQAYASLMPKLAPIGQELGLPPLPPAWDETHLPELQALAQLGMQQSSAGIQSTFVDAQGNRIGVTRDGRTVVLGQNAPNNQIIDTGNGYVGVNKGTLKAAPVVLGGGQAPQAAPPQGTNDEVLRVANAMAQAGVPDAQIEAWMAKQPGMAPASEAPPAQQLRKAPPEMTPYQRESLRIREQGATAAQQARDLAARARKDAADLKASQQAQAASQRQAAAVESADGLIQAIDSLTGHPGFQALGTALGDAQIATPLIRNAAKDAQAQLKNISGQVALATMSKLKALSSQGATGFGALSQQELKLLENSIATLQSDQISNKQLADSLRVIREKMEKIASWQGSPANAPAQAGSAPKRLKFNPATGRIE